MHLGMNIASGGNSRCVGPGHAESSKEAAAAAVDEAGLKIMSGGGEMGPFHCV